METCRVQDTRRRKGLPELPVQGGPPRGQVEFETFAVPRGPAIQTTCLHCPPESRG